MSCPLTGKLCLEKYTLRVQNSWLGQELRPTSDGKKFVLLSPNLPKLHKLDNGRVVHTGQVLTLASKNLIIKRTYQSNSPLVSMVPLSRMYSVNLSKGHIRPTSSQASALLCVTSLVVKLRFCRMTSSLLLSKVSGIKKERDTQNSTSGKGVSSINISSQVLAWSMAVKDHIQNLLRKVQVWITNESNVLGWDSW